MPILEAPECVRYTLHGSYLGRPVANVLDMFIDQPAGSVSHEIMFETAGDILNNWADHIVPGLSEHYTFERITWLDLGDGGWTGERTSTSEHDLPLAGSETSQPISANTSMLVLKSTEAKRGERQGRMFLPGLVEQYVEGNFITPSFVGPFNADGLQPFLDGISDEIPSAPYSRYPVVIHTKGGVFQSWSRITALTLQGRVASQRRRNRP